MQDIKEVTADLKFDYIDGVLVSKPEGATMTRRMTSTRGNDNVLSRFTDANDLWFYLHVWESVSPLAKYLFRYDRGGFWVEAPAFQYFKMPFNSFIRW